MLQINNYSYPCSKQTWYINLVHYLSEQERNVFTFNSYHEVSSLAIHTVLLSGLSASSTPSVEIPIVWLFHLTAQMKGEKNNHWDVRNNGCSGISCGSHSTGLAIRSFISHAVHDGVMSAFPPPVPIPTGTAKGLVPCSKARVFGRSAFLKKMQFLFGYLN